MFFRPKNFECLVGQLYFSEQYNKLLNFACGKIMIYVLSFSRIEPGSGRSVYDFGPFWEVFKEIRENAFDAGINSGYYVNLHNGLKIACFSH